MKISRLFSLILIGLLLLAVSTVSLHIAGKRNIKLPIVSSPKPSALLPTQLQPTLIQTDVLPSLPPVVSSRRPLDPACYKDLNSDACRKKMQARCGIEDTNINPNSPGWDEKIACILSYYPQLAEVACEQKPESDECRCKNSPDPIECMVDLQLSDLRQFPPSFLCRVKEKFAADGINIFSDLFCKASGKSTLQPTKTIPGNFTCMSADAHQKPECQTFLKQRCPDAPFLPACKKYCEDQADSGFLDYVCVEYFKAYCLTLDYSHEGCRQLIYQEYPGVADLCSRFPRLRFCTEIGL